MSDSPQEPLAIKTLSGGSQASMSSSISPSSISFKAASLYTGIILASGFGYSSSLAAQDSAGKVVEEVIVTAQKRDQALSEIPMSVSVLGGEELERQQATNFEDLVNKIPGFSITGNTAGISRITLRGINTGGVASTVAVYLDDVPFGSSSGLANGSILAGDFDTFDMARVEVLRGPQGTLYGASSLGGVLKYVPNAPSTDGVESRFRTTLESVEDGDLGYATTGVINLPLSDQLAVRASGFYRADSGYIDSIGNNPIPSMTDPNVNIHDGTQVEEDINSVDTYGGRIAALYEPSDAFSLNLMAMMQKIETGSSNIIDADPATLQPLHDSPVRSRYHDDFSNIEYQVYSATANWNFDAVTLESITSYGNFEQNYQDDMAAAELVPGTYLSSLVTYLLGRDPETMPVSLVQEQTTATDKFTQELRLLSADNDTFEWMTGVYYTKEDSGIDPQVFTALDPNTGSVASDVPLVADLSLPSTFEEMAVFANGTWYITPDFEVDFGARASTNEQVASQVQDGFLVGGPLEYDDTKSSESPFTYSLSPRYEFSSNASVYARVATGYRPGGPNILPPGAPEDTPRTYDSDTLTSYEVGLKTSSANGIFALDVSAFYLDWEDIQLFAVVNNFGVNGNGGTAVSKGFEFTASLLPADGLNLSLNGAYTDAYLTADTDPVVGGFNGDPLTFVPEWSFGLNGSYEWQVMADATAYVGGDIGYTGDRPAGFSNRDTEGNLRIADSYTTVNLRSGIDMGRWSFELYGKNLTDEIGITAIDAEGSLPNGAVGLGMLRPRTIGLSVGADF